MRLTLTKLQPPFAKISCPSCPLKILVHRHHHLIFTLKTLIPIMDSISHNPTLLPNQLTPFNHSESPVLSICLINSQVHHPISTFLILYIHSCTTSEPQNFYLQNFNFGATITLMSLLCESYCLLELTSVIMCLGFLVYQFFIVILF